MPRLILALAAVLVLAPAATAAAAKPADRVLRNGSIHTVDARDSVREALAVRDGEIVYAGSDAGVRRYIGKRTKVTDLRGRMVMPGLHDGHIHGITEAADACSLNYEPLTVAELTARLQACLDATPGEEPGGWLQASSWYQQFVLPAGTVVTREVLDGLRTQRPIVVSSSDGHTSLVNSRGLALAGITAATPDPANGRIEHDAAGEPNGLLQDGAQRLVSALLPAPTGDPVDEARRGMQRFAREGITSFYVPGFVGADGIAAFAKLRKAGGLTARAHFAIGAFTPGADTVASLSRTGDRLRKRFETRLPRSVRAWRPGRAARPAARPRAGHLDRRHQARARRRRAGAGADRRAARALPRRRAAGSQPRRALPRQPAARAAADRLRAARLPVPRARDRRPRRARDPRRGAGDAQGGRDARLAALARPRRARGEAGPAAASPTCASSR